MSVRTDAGVDSDTQVWDKIVMLHARVEHELTKVLQRRHGLGLSEYRALCRLAAAPDGELRMQELAEFVGLNQSSVSRLAARLESAGLTRRDLCPNDRRGVYSVITEEGRAQQADAAATYEQTLRAVLDAAQADRELGGVVAALRP